MVAANNDIEQTPRTLDWRTARAAAYAERIS